MINKKEYLIELIFNKLKNNKSKKLLLWRPKYKVEKIIELIKEWYFQGLKKNDNEKIILKQIKEFLIKK